jgi:uncharacterized protein
MRMADVNILVYAHREESPSHSRYALWLTTLATGPEPFAISELVLHGFIRVVTNPRIFDPPSTLEQAFEFIDALTSRPGCVLIRPGTGHWKIYRGLCETGSLTAKLTADAVHAALAIENGCEWVSADTDFVRFQPTLRFLHL